MYARVSSVQLQPGRGDEGPRLWQERLLPRLKEQKGFKGLILMRDQEAGRGMSITFWEAAADAQVLESGRFAEELRTATRPLLAGPPTIAGYEVLIHEDV